MLSRITMSPSAPPARRGTKRPWYLVCALVLAWLFGAGAMTDGCENIGYFEADRAELTRAAQDRLKDADPDAVAKVTERFFDAMDSAKSRVFPFAVASLLLGAAMWGLAFGAMAGRGGARAALVQVLAVSAVVRVVEYVATPDIRAAHTAADIGLAALSPADTPAMKEGRHLYIQHRAKKPTFGLVLHLGLDALLLLALTRRRTREFYEARAAARAEL
jgi:hypothetical protein